jgi:ribosomal protein S6
MQSYQVLAHLNPSNLKELLQVLKDSKTRIGKMKNWGKRLLNQTLNIFNEKCALYFEGAEN